MATLGDGWTVIGPSATSRESNNEKNHLENNGSKDEEHIDTNLSSQQQKKNDASFAPPLATWFDEVHLHFVVLQDTELSEIVVDDEPTGKRRSLGNRNDNDMKRGGSGSRKNFWNQWNQNKHSNSSINGRDNIDEKDGIESDLSKYEFLIYQKLRIPSNLSRYPVYISDEISESLISEPPLRIALPIQLTQQKKKVLLKNNDKNDKEKDYITDIVTTYTSVRRAPMLAKFSTNQKYLAIQFSTTCVRLVPTTALKDPKDEKPKHHQQHWTIDLNMDAGIPCSSSAYEMPSFSSETAANDSSSKNRRSLFKRNSSKSDESIQPGITSLLAGGVLWFPGNKKNKSEHQRNKKEDDVISNNIQHHDHDEELLLLVANTGLMIYKVSLTNQRLIVSKFESIPFQLKQITSNTTSILSQAVAFWYEPKGGALLVGSYNSLSTRSGIPSHSSFRKINRSSMQIRTFFFQPLLEGKNTTTISPPISASDVITLKQPYSFTFEVGIRSNVESAQQLIQPEDLAIVNVYGRIYFVELETDSDNVILYSLGPNISTYMTKYAPDGFSIGCKSHVSVFISVLDNLIVCLSRENKKSLYIDVADPVENCLLIDDSKCFEEGKEDVINLYNSGNSFLAPSFLLNPKGRGFVSQIQLNSQKLSDSFPWSKKNLTLFLLRRSDSGPETVHMILLKRIRSYFEKNGDISPEVAEFIDQFGVMYANNTDARTWDNQACLPFIYKAALLPTAVKKINNCGLSTYEFSKSGYPLMKPANNYLDEATSGVKSTLTQSEILQHILLPISYSAVVESDFAKLRIMLNFSISFIGSLQQKSLEPCEAIYCLVIALFWRLGDGADIIGFLRSFKYHCTFISKEVNTGACDENEHALQMELRKTRFEAFAEMLIMIVTTVPFGETLEDAKLNRISSLDNSLSHHQDDNTEEEKHIRDSVLTYAVDIMCSVSSHRVAARFLLKVGRVTDAITICSKIMHDETVLYHRSKGNGTHDKPLILVDQGTTSVDFFKAIVYTSSNMKGLGERARLFYHTNKFLRRWDPHSFQERKEALKAVSKSVVPTKSNELPASRTSFVKTKSEGTVGQVQNNQSLQNCRTLAESLKSFPDDLLGGADNPICKEVKMMYGF